MVSFDVSKRKLYIMLLKSYKILYSNLFGRKYFPNIYK